MALREIVKDNNEFLSKKSRPVEKIDGRIKQLVDDMKETLIKADGVGLAAPQVGVLKRIFVVDINVDKSDIREFINPEIIKKKGSSGHPTATSVQMNMVEAWKAAAIFR